ncbi:hypothetical protein SE17_03605 [Kouleothrix aurantiaca]|uniref:Uncharacterized protein n=1 Tax=Kouleothrix aurantiaca TaxID=186479 RepID=A0A0P9D9U0_9CHLR|nr:hypothetical protein SE17_03605 [Kouleothrix aurantiaca]
MNSLLESEFPLHETQGLRYELLKALTDTDLAYKLAGDNPTRWQKEPIFGLLVAVCRAIQQSYARTLAQAHIE